MKLIYLIFLLGLTSSGHNLHLTYSKVVVDEKELLIKISFFPDDFELLLSAHAGRDITGLKNDGDADSLLHLVLKKELTVKVNGSQLKATILKSGVESDMCWYLLSFTSATEIKILEIDNRILFNQFTDQKNMISLEDVRTGKKDSFYGLRGASGYKKEF